MGDPFDIQYDDVLHDLLYQKITSKNKDRQTTFVPGHLATPIYNTECELMQEIEWKNVKCFRHRVLFNKIKELRNKNKTIIFLLNDEPDPFSQLEKLLMEMIPSENQSEVNKLLKALSTSTQVWAMQLLHNQYPLLRGHLLSLVELDDYTSKIREKIEIALWSLRSEFIKMNKVEYLKDEICFKDIIIGEFSSYSIGKVRIIEADRDITFLYKGEKVFVFPTSFLLGTLDLIQGRFPLKLYWKLADIFDKYPGLSLYERGEYYIGEFEKLRSMCPIGFFGIMATWESLIVGWVVSQDDDEGCVDLFESQKAEIQALLQENGQVYSINRILPEGNSKYQIMMELELIGLSKAFGYPTLDSSKLLDQLRKYGIGLNYEMNVETITEVEGVVIREFIKNYKLKNSVYPNFSYVPHELKFLLKNKPIPVVSEQKYDLWSQIKFSKTFEYDYTPDQTELVKDSASAPPLSQWASSYDKCASFHLYGKDLPHQDRNPDELRTLTHFLTAEEDEIRKIISEREKGVYSEEDHVSVQCGKEKELKEGSGRAFNKQTNIQRFAQTSMEYNISTQIFPYVPQQAMTDSEISVTLKVLEQNRKMTGEDHIFISLDLTKWCIHWRMRVVLGVSSMLDDLFGLVGLFKNAHTNFIDCNIFTNNRLTPPDHENGVPIEGRFFMNHYQGGFEGMQQKKWTLFTSGVIVLALEKADLEGEVMGQGDNQVIVVKTKPEWSLLERNRARYNFMSVLDKLFMDTHHKLKEKETWFSRHLHEFSKNRYYKGSCVSSSTKKSIKLIPDSNDGLFSLPSSMATINTMTESISRTDFLPHMGYILNNILITNFMLRKKILKFGSQLDINIITSLMTPTDFGGFPRSTLNGHLMRGFDDKVTLWVSILKTLYSCGKYKQEIEKITSVWVYNKTSTSSLGNPRVKLLEDPYCLNIRSLPSADSKIKGFVEKLLKSDEVTNPVIKKLYINASEDTKEKLANAMDTSEVLYPQLPHSIYVNTNDGLLMRNRSKFTSSKTLEKIVKQNEAMSLIELIKEENKKAVKLFLQRLRSLDYNNRVFQLITSLSCVIEISNVLRKESWGKELVFVSRPEFSCQTTVTTPDQSITLLRNGRNLLTQLSTEALQNPRQLIHSFGLFKPFLGKMTTVKMTKLSIDFAEKTSCIRALKQLIQTRAWTQVCGLTGYTKLINDFIDEKKKVIVFPEGVELTDSLLPEIIGGNIIHRFRTQSESRLAMLNLVPSIPSNFKHTSNLLRSMTERGEDFTIYYQYLYIMITACITINSQIAESIEPFYHTNLSCETCTQEVSNHSILDTDITYTPIQDSSFPLQTTPLVVPTSLSQKDVYKYMSVFLGKLFAKSVDASFSLNHDSRGKIDNNSRHVSVTSTKLDISINDLKALDLEMILMSMILYSNHCQNLISEAPSILMANTYDKSFTNICMMLIEGGLVSNLFLMLEIEPTEHNMVVQAEKLSAYLSRAIMFLKKERVIYLYKKTFSSILISTNDNQNISDYVKVLLAKIALILNRRNALSDMQLEHINYNLRRSRTYQAYKLLGLLPPKLTNSSISDLISIWRLIRKDISVYVQPCNLIRVKNRIGQRAYPIVEYGCLMELIARDENKFISCNVLAFCCRPLGYISSAPSKFIEVLMMCQFKLIESEEREKVIYCLAEGAGGTARSLNIIFGRKVVYNSLNLPNVVIKDDISDTTPPGLKTIRGDQLLHADLLNLGTTDITSPKFIEKLMMVFRVDKPYIITMDAESVTYSSNLDFLSALGPTIFCFDPKVVIFKMFLMIDFREFVRDYPGYEWVVIKPLSSNPMNQECYLVYYQSSLNNSNTLLLKRLESTVVSNFTFSEERDSRFSEQCTRTYLNVSDKVRKTMICTYPELILPTKFSNIISELEACCLLCNKMIVNNIQSIDRLNTELYSHLMFIRVRASGTADSLFKEMLLLLFQVIAYFYRRNPVLAIIKLERVLILTDVQLEEIRHDLTSVFRLKIEGSGNFFANFGDGKFATRDLLEGSSCQCKFKPIEYRAKESETSLVLNQFRKLLSDIFGREIHDVVNRFIKKVD